MPIYYLQNTIQNYEWGSYTAISKLLNKKFPCSLPQAELWMGAHPKASSNIVDNFDKNHSLKDFIEKNPLDILGKQVYKKFGSKLPYLMKVLAADKPLSIQVHPNKDQAISGFKKENYEQKLIDSPERIYKDKNHKIECMCALTPLWSLNGFRKIDEMHSLINMICPDILIDHFETFLQKPNSIGLKNFFCDLSFLSKKEIELAISQALMKVNFLREKSIIFEWINRLADIYPNELSVFAPIVLNLVKLEPGQAILTTQGVPHTYMNGMGIEVMTNSDNVIRGGLTNKHTNIFEFFNITEFIHKPIFFIETERLRPCETLYKTDTMEFMLSIINVNDSEYYVSPKTRSAEILFCTSGNGVIINISSDSVIKIRKGDSFLITSSTQQYEIRGKLKVFKAGVLI